METKTEAKKIMPVTMGDSYDTNDTEGKEAANEKLAEGEGAQEDASTSEETQENESENESIEVSDEEKPKKDESEEVSVDSEAESDDGVDQEMAALEAIRKQKDDLLREVSDLRKERRGLRQGEEKELFVPKKTAKQTDDLEDINPDDLKIIEKAAKKLGFVKQEEIAKSTYDQHLNSQVDAWVQKHPDYLPENDPEDKRWAALQKTMRDLFEAYPSDPKKIGKMLDIAHRELNPAATLPVKSRATTDAAKAKIASSAKVGGGSAPAPQKMKANIDKSKYVGFTDEEIEEFLS